MLDVEIILEYILEHIFLFQCCFKHINALIKWIPWYQGHLWSIWAHRWIWSSPSCPRSTIPAERYVHRFQPLHSHWFNQKRYHCHHCVIINYLDFWARTSLLMFSSPMAWQTAVYTFVINHCHHFIQRYELCYHHSKGIKYHLRHCWFGERYWHYLGCFDLKR